MDRENIKFKLKPDNRNSLDKDLIKDLKGVVNKLGKKTISRSEYDKFGRYSEGTLRKRFGGWLNVLKYKIGDVLFGDTLREEWRG